MDIPLRRRRRCLWLISLYGLEQRGGYGVHAEALNVYDNFMVAVDEIPSERQLDEQNSALFSLRTLL